MDFLVKKGDLQLHNTECQLYEKFKECSELSKLQVYVSHPFTEQNPDKGYLIMEYVEDIVNMGNETYLEEKLVDQVGLGGGWRPHP